MDLPKVINDLENYELAVQDAKSAATSLLAGLDGFFDEITKNGPLSANDLLALKEQYKLNQCQRALTKALTKL